MAITRRELAGILAATAAAAAPQSAGSPAGAPAGSDDEETRSAHDALKDNAQQLGQVKVPMATEPACHFKA
jgi:hypothetical protein